MTRNSNDQAHQTAATGDTFPQNIRILLNEAKLEYPDDSPLELAEKLIGDFLSASFQREFSYSCTVNPDNIPAYELFENEDHARNQMMAALSVLPRDDAEALLELRQLRDHDGSSFPVTNLAKIKRWVDDQAASSPSIPRPNGTIPSEPARQEFPQSDARPLDRGPSNTSTHANEQERPGGFPTTRLADSKADREVGAPAHRRPRIRP